MPDERDGTNPPPALDDALVATALRLAALEAENHRLREFAGLAAAQRFVSAEEVAAAAREALGESGEVTPR